MMAMRKKTEQTRPDVALREFGKMMRKDSALPAETVVDAARPNASPLHSLFECDDGVASERYRNVKDLASVWE